MAYKAKAPFIDKFTKEEYEKGNPYTHNDEKRIAFLVEKGFLEEVPTVERNNEVNHVGGGWYELPNGEKVQGKDEALSALETLESGE